MSVRSIIVTIPLEDIHPYKTLHVKIRYDIMDQQEPENEIM